MIVASFFTPDGKYAALAARLRASCDRVGLRHKIVQLPPQRDWRTAINLKPSFILQMLLDTREPVLWLDCDCEVRRYPDLLTGTAADFGVLNWRATDPRYTGDEILNSGGASYWAYTAPAIELLVRWQQTCAADPGQIDDQMLDRAWARFRPPVKVLWFPREMNWMNPQFGPTPENCIIWHDYVDGRHREAVETEGLIE